jgi:hypothetical protein
MAAIIVFCAYFVTLLILALMLLAKRREIKDRMNGISGRTHAEPEPPASSK